MTDSVAGLILAAGAGSRLHPLTIERPKPLCPVGGRTNLDRTLDAVAAITSDLTVNAHTHADQVVAHVGSRARMSVERELLGTGGAIGRLRPWIDGRPLIVCNADLLHDLDLRVALDGWDTERIRFLTVGPDGTRLHARLRLVATVLPGWASASLPDEPCDVFTELWRPAERTGRTEFVESAGAWFDCGTLSAYLDAHQWLTGERVNVWPGAEHRTRPWLRDAVVTPTRTVLVR